jgi:hypothetical protein
MQYAAYCILIPAYFSGFEKQQQPAAHSLLHRHLHIHLDHIVSDTMNASSAREPFVLPKVMPLRPKWERYTPTKAVMVVRKSSRQMIQFTAVHAPEQEQLFIGDRVKDRARVGLFSSVHNDRLPSFLFT